MRSPTADETASLWAAHGAEWRDPAQVAGQWREADRVDPRLLRRRVRGAFWETLAATGATLLVGREYEHLLMALRVGRGGPEVTYLPMPHPSGIAVDLARRRVHVASTRNPNQVFELAPVEGAMPRLDAKGDAEPGAPLVPVRSTFHPGCLYLHDLAFVGGALHGAAAGLNAVVRLDGEGAETAWWPRCVERRGRPFTAANHVQLNSIAAGRDLASSFFTASADEMTSRRPGQRNFPVDRRGVAFSGATREPVLRGLTRPHSARLHGAKLFVADSGYGAVVVNDGGRPETVARLPGWTRGLAFAGDALFVATSRVIPKFRAYAPGLDADASECALHALDPSSGALLGSLVWPWGNQVFAVEALPAGFADGLPFSASRPGATSRHRRLFYTFRTASAPPRRRKRKDA